MTETATTTTTTGLLERAHSTGVGADVPRRWQRVSVDPVTLQVIGGAMQAIASEMAEYLVRMASSSIMRESRDIGAGILDFHGRQLCESDSTPMHCGSLPAYVRGVERKLEGRYEDGDVILHNHPYHGASHSPDYGVLMPIIHRDEHLGFTGCTGHMIDIGAANPGFSVDVPDFWAEGQIIDAIKVYRAGVRQDDVWSLIMDNVRTPQANTGDVEAMIACCRRGVTRFVALLERYGRDIVMSAAEEWMDYAERLMRERIDALADGTYDAPVGWLEDDGKNFGTPLKIATRVIVSGSDIVIDLTGSNEQVETGFNCPFEGSVLPAANFAVRSLLLDEAIPGQDVPQNDGIFRPIHVIAPRGSLFNPIEPRGCEARFTQINRIPDQVLQALSTSLPELVTAGNSAGGQLLRLFRRTTGWLADTYWVSIEVNEGSYGGRFGSDGLDAVDNLMANHPPPPPPPPPQQSDRGDGACGTPLLCERYELRSDAPAPGRWRGGSGCGQTLALSGRERAPARLATNRIGRSTQGSLRWGSDGRPGRVLHLVAEPEDGKPSTVELPSKISSHRFAAGDRLEVQLVSGAGYGSPRERDPAAVLADVVDELIDVDEARDVYAVAIDLERRCVDEAATGRLRSGG